MNEVNGFHDDLESHPREPRRRRSSRRPNYLRWVAVGAVAAAITIGVSWSIVHLKGRRQQIRDQEEHICVERQIEDLKGSRMQLVFGGLSEPLTLEEQQLVEESVEQAYNTVSEGCADKYDRWMVKSVFESQEVVTAGNMTGVVATIDLAISCNGCPEEEIFADTYPDTFSGDLERRLQEDEPVQKDSFLTWKPLRMLSTMVLVFDEEASIDASDVIIEIERVIVESGAMENLEFDGVISARIEDRNQKLVANMAKGKKKKKKLGKKQKGSAAGGAAGGFISGIMVGPRGKGKKKYSEREAIAELIIKILGNFFFPIFGTEAHSEAVCSEFAMPLICNDMFSFLSTVFSLLQYSQCNGANPTMQQLLEVYVQCSDTFSGNSLLVVDEPFCPKQFHDGISELGPITLPNGTIVDLAHNQYAWGGDFNKKCGIGLMIHSSGTQNLIDRNLTMPTLTLRDDEARQVYHGPIYNTNIDFPVVNYGIRSALVVDCEDDILTIVMATIGEPGEMVRYKLNMTHTPYKPIEYAEIPLDSQSVRTMIQLGEDKCKVSFLPLNDLHENAEDMFEDEYPVIQTYDWCGFTRRDLQEDGSRKLGSPHILGSKLLKEDASDSSSGGINFHKKVKYKDLDGHVGWEMECDEVGSWCWVNTAKKKKKKRYNAGFDIVPRLFYFNQSHLAGPETIQMKEIAPNFDIDSSAYSIEPIDDDSAMICTLSGFAYQAMGDIDTVLGRRMEDKDRKLDDLDDDDLFVDDDDVFDDDRFDDDFFLFDDDNIELAPGKSKRFENAPGAFLADYLQVELASLELGQAQQCKVCCVSTDSCRDVVIPNQAATNAYMWQVKKCGDYIFAGSLDNAGIFARTILEEVFGVTDNTDLTLTPGLTAWISSLLVSNFIGRNMSPYDFGWDLWQMPLSDLEKIKTDPDFIPIFTPVTVNGFRKEISPVPYFGLLWPPQWEFNPMEPFESGVRQMVCHKDSAGNSKLVIGTSVFAKQQHSTTWVLDVNSNGQCAPDQDTWPVRVIEFDPALMQDPILQSIPIDQGPNAIDMHQVNLFSQGSPEYASDASPGWLPDREQLVLQYVP